MSKAKKKSSFKLTREEQLELENLQLKESALKNRLLLLQGLQKEWGEKVAKKHGVDLREFLINVDTGICNRQTKGAK